MPPQKKRKTQDWSKFEPNQKERQKVVRKLEDKCNELVRRSKVVCQVLILILTCMSWVCCYWDWLVCVRVDYDNHDSGRRRGKGLRFGFTRQLFSRPKWHIQRRNYQGWTNVFNFKEAPPPSMQFLPKSQVVSLLVKNASIHDARVLFEIAAKVWCESKGITYHGLWSKPIPDSWPVAGGSCGLFECRKISSDQPSIVFLLQATKWHLQVCDAWRSCFQSSTPSWRCLTVLWWLSSWPH